jgi:hypothetical protein
MELLSLFYFFFRVLIFFKWVLVKQEKKSVYFIFEIFLFVCFFIFISKFVDVNGIFFIFIIYWNSYYYYY